MNTVNTHARRAKGVITMMPEGRGLHERLPPKGKASAAITAMIYTKKGVCRRRRYEPRNSGAAEHRRSADSWVHCCVRMRFSRRCTWTLARFVTNWSAVVEVDKQSGY